MSSSSVPASALGGGDRASASDQFEKSSAHAIASAESLLDVVRRQMEASDAAEKQLRAKVAELQARLDGNNGAATDVERAEEPTDSNHKLRSELNALRVENAMLKVDIGDAAAARKNLAKVTQEKQALLGEVFSVKVLNGNLIAANDSVRAELAVTKAVMAHLRDSKEALTKEMADLVEDRRAEISTLKASNEELTTALDSARAELKKATTDSTQLTETNAALSKKLTAYKTDYEQLRKELEAANEALGTLMHSSSNLTAANADLRGQVGELKVKIERLTIEQRTTQDELTVAKTEVSSLQREKDALCSELSAMAARRGQTEAKMAALVQELASIKSENTQLSEHKAELEHRLRASERVQQNLETKSLIAFFDQTFDCTGRTDVLHVALGTLHDRMLSQDGAGVVSELSAGSRYAPKPLLLIHQIDLPQSALGGATLAAGSGPVAVESPGLVEGGNASGVTQPASSPVRSEESASSRARTVMNEGGGEQERISTATKGNDEHRQSEHDSNEQPSGQEEKKGTRTPPPAREEADTDSAVVKGVEEPKGQEDENADSSDHEEEEEEEGEQSPPVTRRKAAQSAKRLQSSRVIPDTRRSPRNVFETPPAKRRRSSLGVETGSASAPKSSRSPRSTPSSGARHDDETEASDDDAVSISDDDIQQLYDFEPWERLYRQRPRFSRTFRYQSLSEDAQEWVDKALSFRDAFRKELWERQHWFYVPIEHRSAKVSAFLTERSKRSVAGNTMWRMLCSKAESLISSGELTSAVWNEPFLWTWRDSPFSWKPKSSNLVEELARIDEQEPERCFHIGPMFTRHPFYTSGLSRQHKAKFRLPTA